MKAKLLGIALGGCLLAALAAPAWACPFHPTSASDDQTQQQTAQSDASQQPQQQTPASANN